MSHARRSDMAAGVAAAFDLGAVTGELRPVPGGLSHLLWQLRTTKGVWAVKQLNRSREPWWTADHEIAAEIEDAAFRHGIAMPRPVRPVYPAAPLPADVPVGGTVLSFLVHEWCAGTVLTDADVTPAVSEWVGETLAALHSLPVALDVAGAKQSRPHPLEEWKQWLGDTADDVPADFVRAVSAFLPDIERAGEAVDRAPDRMDGGPAPVLTHGDVKPGNVLLTRTSPVLLDWDGAGPDFAEWEATRTALAFSRSPGGWDPDAFVRVIRTYEAVSGRSIAPVAASFAGVLRSRLGGAAWLLWRALGHRPVTAAERASAYGHTLEYLADLRASLTQTEHWAHWLEDARP